MVHRRADMCDRLETMPPNHLAAPDDAQTTTGGVVVVADVLRTSAPPPPCRIAAWIAAGIHRRMGGTV
jgi:hypothetical protein